MANNVDIFFTHKVTCKINIFSECQTTEWVQPNPPDRTVGRGQGREVGGSACLQTHSQGVGIKQVYNVEGYNS